LPNTQPYQKGTLDVIGALCDTLNLLAVKTLQPALFQPKFAERRQLSHIFLNLAKPIFYETLCLKTKNKDVN
jgi:hypothetical protein|tara:strand:- start:236 stop:451 length:216 start_codon:yes stop_codon:yes gene_type:complete